MFTCVLSSVLELVTADQLLKHGDEYATSFHKRHAPRHIAKKHCSQKHDDEISTC